MHGVQWSRGVACSWGEEIVQVELEMMYVKQPPTPALSEFGVLLTSKQAERITTSFIVQTVLCTPTVSWQTRQEAFGAERSVWGSNASRRRGLLQVSFCYTFTMRSVRWNTCPWPIDFILKLPPSCFIIWPFMLHVKHKNVGFLWLLSVLFLRSLR